MRIDRYVSREWSMIYISAGGGRFIPTLSFEVCDHALDVPLDENGEVVLEPTSYLSALRDAGLIPHWRDLSMSVTGFREIGKEYPLAQLTRDDAEELRDALSSADVEWLEEIMLRLQNAANRQAGYR
jgi:hypothetical protein